MPRIVHEVEPARGALGARAARAPIARLGRLARLALLATALLGAAPACDATTEAPALAEALAPHEEAIDRFARWATRASAPSTSRDPARLEETLFAPVRDDARFVVVVVEREGRPPLRLRHPAGAEIPALSFREVRCRRLGLLEASRDPAQPADVWARVRVGEEPPLVITVRVRGEAP